MTLVYIILNKEKPITSTPQVQVVNKNDISKLGENAIPMSSDKPSLTNIPTEDKRASEKSTNLEQADDGDDGDDAVAEEIAPKDDSVMQEMKAYNKLGDKIRNGIRSWLERARQKLYNKKYASHIFLHNLTYASHIFLHNLTYASHIFLHNLTIL
jgi:hypothetical protein